MELLDAIIPLTTLIIGVVLGHKLNIRRDKRTEFNSIATSVYVKLNDQMERIKKGLFPVHDGNEITQEEFIKLKRASNKSYAKTVQTIYNEYLLELKKCINYPPDFKYGDKLLIKLDEIEKKIERFQKLLEKNDCC